MPTAGTLLAPAQLNPGTTAASAGLTSTARLIQGANAAGDGAGALTFATFNVGVANDTVSWDFDNLSLDPGEWFGVRGALLLASTFFASLQWDETVGARG